MKKLTSISLLIILIGMFACTRVKEPEFKSVEGFRIKKLELQQAVIGFGVTFYNPNNFGLTVKEAEADIYIDSIYLGKFVQDSSVEVKKNAVFFMSFSGSVPLQTTLQLDFQHFTERDILVKAEGSVKIGKVGVFITKPLHYERKHRLDEIKF